MDARTLTALKASIKHWEENVAAEHPASVTLGIIACALCAEFRRNDCNGCPVSVRTRGIACHGTPYGEAQGAYYRWRDDAPADEAAKLAWRKAAQAELDFLKSLLPVEEAAE